MANPNPAAHLHHKFETYERHLDALARVNAVNALGYKAYLVLATPVKVHITEGKQPDLAKLPTAPVRRPVTKPAPIAPAKAQRRATMVCRLCGNRNGRQLVSTPASAARGRAVARVECRDLRACDRRAGKGR